MNDDTTLRDKARECLQAGRLPTRLPDRTWGGPGAGDGCTICGTPVSSEELELELEFTGRDGVAVGKHHVHVRCYGAWEVVRQQFLSAGGSGAPGAARPQGDDPQPARADARLNALPAPTSRGKMAGDGRGPTYNGGAA